MKKVLKDKIMRRKRRAHWRPFGYDVRQDKDLFRPFRDSYEADDWYINNCFGCSRGSLMSGFVFCDLADAVATGCLTQSQLARIGGVVYEIFKCSCCKKKFKLPILSACKERPNPILPVKFLEFPESSADS